MEDRYRLVFRGEVLEGHHAVVVKEKLGAALKAEGERLEELFQGKPVVIKRDADTATSARYQAAFKRAGARLRVLPVADRTPEDEAAPASAPSKSTSSAPAPQDNTADATFMVRPVGTLLDATERPAPRVVQVDVSHLSLAAVGVRLDERPTPATPAVPDTSRFTLAELGADLSTPAERIRTLEVTLDADWELAAPGALLGTPKPVQPAIDVARVNFDLAPTGADLGQRRAPPPPTAPDTSHLELA